MCISSLSSVRVLVCACMIVGKCVCVLERERLNAHARARKSKGVGSDSGDRRYCGNASLCFIEATVLRDCLSIDDR